MSLGSVTGFSLPTLQALAVLTPNQREALLGHAMLGLTLAVVAGQMGLSVPRVAQLEREALTRLRRGSLRR